jgi:hypothetical protein
VKILTNVNINIIRYEKMRKIFTGFGKPNGRDDQSNIASGADAAMMKFLGICTRAGQQRAAILFR